MEYIPFCGGVCACSMSGNGCPNGMCSVSGNGCPNGMCSEW